MGSSITLFEAISANDRPSSVGAHVRRRHLALNMLNDPMKHAKFTFALLMTTCIAWGCTTRYIRGAIHGSGARRRAKL